MERYCPDDSKNISLMGVGLMLGVLDLTLSYLWGGGHIYTRNKENIIFIMSNYQISYKDLFLLATFFKTIQSLRKRRYDYLD